MAGDVWSDFSYVFILDVFILEIDGLYHFASDQ